MHYNVLKYGDVGCMAANVKDGLLRTIFNTIQPDILTLNEMAGNQNSVNNLRANCLAYNPSMTWAGASNTNGSEIENALYYNADKLALLSRTAIVGNIRDIDVYRLMHKAASQKGDTLDLWCIVAHFKAGTDFPNQRAEAARDIADWLEARSDIKRYVISGDFNLYGSNEPAWQTLTGGAKPLFLDPAEALTGWQGLAFAKYHTQSPANGENDCAVEGGLDDRFDFILYAPELASGTVRLEKSTFAVFGNDGVSYNESLRCDETTSVSTTVCHALVKASDHLPLVVKLTFPKEAEKILPFGLTLLGNPVHRGETLTFRLETDKKGRYYWEILDILGRRMDAGSDFLEAPPGKDFSSSVGVLNDAGAYQLVVRNSEGEAVSVKFLVIP